MLFSLPACSPIVMPSYESITMFCAQWNLLWFKVMRQNYDSARYAVTQLELLSTRWIRHVSSRETVWNGRAFLCFSLSFQTALRVMMAPGLAPSLSWMSYGAKSCCCHSLSMSIPHDQDSKSKNPQTFYRNRIVQFLRGFFWKAAQTGLGGDPQQDCWLQVLWPASVFSMEKRQLHFHCLSFVRFQGLYCNFTGANKPRWVRFLRITK